jgi:hypothetical protein
MLKRVSGGKIRSRGYTLAVSSWKMSYGNIAKHPLGAFHVVVREVLRQDCIELPASPRHLVGIL